MKTVYKTIKNEDDELLQYMQYIQCKLYMTKFNDIQNFNIAFIRNMSHKDNITLIKDKLL